MKYKLLIIPILVFGLVSVFTLNAGAVTSNNETERPPETRQTSPTRVQESDKSPTTNSQETKDSNDTTSGDEMQSVTNNRTMDQENRSQTGQAAKERAQVKLESKKLEVCKKRQEVMKSTMTRMEDRSSKHIAWLDSVVEKVKSFYSTKGLTVADYDTLLANVVSARAAAVSSGNQLGQYQQEFSCDGNDPKSVINDFKTQHQSQVDTVKSYKEAVKALAEAVKAAAEASGQNTTDTTNTPTGGAN